jgi:hypothetical protein
VAVTRASATLRGGATQAFSVTVTGSTTTNVAWSVNGTAGGSDAGNGERDRLAHGAEQFANTTERDGDGDERAGHYQVRQRRSDLAESVAGDQLGESDDHWHGIISDHDYRYGVRENVGGDV